MNIYLAIQEMMIQGVLESKEPVLILKIDTSKPFLPDIFRHGGLYIENAYWYSLYPCNPRESCLAQAVSLFLYRQALYQRSNRITCN